MHLINRRNFLQTAIGSLVCSLSCDWRNLLVAQHNSIAFFDLIVKEGKDVDPSQGISALKDIAISDQVAFQGGRIKSRAGQAINQLIHTDASKIRKAIHAR